MCLSSFWCVLWRTVFPCYLLLFGERFVFSTSCAFCAFMMVSVLFFVLCSWTFLSVLTFFCWMRWLRHKCVAAPWLLQNCLGCAGCGCSTFVDAPWLLRCRCVVVALSVLRWFCFGSFVSCADPTFACVWLFLSCAVVACVFRVVCVMCFWRCLVLLFSPFCFFLSVSLVPVLVVVPMVSPLSSCAFRPCLAFVPFCFVPRCRLCARPTGVDFFGSLVKNKCF